MHSCICVITDEFPSLKILEKKMEPYFKYREGDIDESVPPFKWDGWEIGGRYCGRIKLKIDHEDEMYNWGHYVKTPRAGRLYRSLLLENCIEAGKMLPIGNDLWHCSEERYYSYFGYYDGYLRVDGCRIEDVIDFEKTATSTLGFIGKNGEAYIRKFWNGEKWVDDETYEEKVKEAINNVEDCYITYVDIHY